MLETIYNLLNPIITSYYEEAPEKANLPYAVYSIENSDINVDDSHRDNTTLVINLYANLSQIDTLESKTNNIIALDNTISNDYLFTILNRANFPTLNSNLRHRQIRFMIKHY